MQTLSSCCWSCRRAASAGHYECFKLRIPYGPRNRQDKEAFELLRIALWRGHAAFARRIYIEQHVDAPWFAWDCISNDDAAFLRSAVGFCPAADLVGMCQHAALGEAVGCLRVLLESGVPWGPYSLRFALTNNRLDILELVLPLTTVWCRKVPTAAACLGRLRFLMRIVDAGCPIWTSATDGNAEEIADAMDTAVFCILDGKGSVGVDDLMVSSDLVRSGPVLLYAAQKGVPLTPCMKGMLEEVRRRALALAGCFHRAAALSRKPGARARKWGAMGRVPVELVERIATLAKISIVAVDLIE